MITKEKILRKSSIIIGLIIIIGGIILSINLAKSSNKTEIVEKTNFVKSVEVTEIRNTSINQHILTTGTLKASKSIDIYTVVIGTLLAGKKQGNVNTTISLRSLLLATQPK